MKCPNQVCPKCRKGLRYIEATHRNEKDKWVCINPNCNAEYNKPSNVLCNSTDFRTLESLKKEHRRFNTRLLLCESCGQGYFTAEKIFSEYDLSGYIAYRNAILTNTKDLENQLDFSDIKIQLKDKN